MPSHRRKRDADATGDADAKTSNSKGAAEKKSDESSNTGRSAGKRRNQKSKDSNEKSKTDQPTESTQSPARQGIQFKHIAIRFMTILSIVLLMQWYNTPATEKPLAQVGEVLQKRRMPVECSKDFKEDIKKFKDCAPTECSRVIMDGHISAEEATSLLRIAKRGLKHGGSNGGASILDLHSGALSKGNNFINIYKLMESGEIGNIFKKEDFDLYSTVARKIQLAIAGEYNIQPLKIHLTHPTFFSRITNKPAKTVHDEYWHTHVDKETYNTFDYTSLLYLTDYDTDFEGGRFVFTDKDANRTVEPKLGRLSFFTSGSENTHHVEKVTSGTRYAITVSFTCDKAHAIKAPKLPSKSKT